MEREIPIGIIYTSMTQVIKLQKVISGKVKGYALLVSLSEGNKQWLLMLWLPLKIKLNAWSVCMHCAKTPGTLPCFFFLPWRVRRQNPGFCYVGASLEVGGEMYGLCTSVLNIWSVST